MATTDKLGLSVTREIDHQTLSFGDWRYLQDGDDNNSNTKKIDDWAQLVDSTITSGCAAFISGGTLANESFLLLSENSSLPNAKIVLSGCGIELRQEAQEAHLMLNLEGDSVLMVVEYFQSQMKTIHTKPLYTILIEILVLLLFWAME